MARRAVPLALRAFQGPEGVPLAKGRSICASRVSEGRRALQIVPDGSSSDSGVPKESGEEGKKKKGCHLDIPIFT